MTDEAEMDRVVNLILDDWDSLGVEKGADGILHLPTTIKRRNVDGSLDETPVMLRVLSNSQRVLCRAQAREWIEGMKGLDEKKDSDLFDDLENFCYLSYAIRDREFPFIQHCKDAQILWDKYDTHALTELWGVYGEWVSRTHPRFGQYTGEEFWDVIARIKVGADFAPLAGMPGYAQATCIVFMAKEAANSPNAPSWLRSSETSTPEESASTSSEAG